MRSRLLQYWIPALALLVAGCSGEKPIQGPVRIASTTSTAATGLLDYLAEKFKADTGLEMQYVAVGTGMALKHGENGDVDVLMVHAPKAEEEFVAAGYGVARIPLMWNDFIIAGPSEDPAEVIGSPSAVEAFRRIAAREAPFVSRADDSGTHKKELELWQLAGLKPSGAWYIEAGQGMGACLTMADEKGAYLLTDRGTWLAMKDDLALVISSEGDPSLLNPYSVIEVSPERYPDLHHAAAKKFIDWLTSERGQTLIGAYCKDGVQLFHPNAEKPKSS